MDMPQPSEGHALFETLAGTWRGDETMHPSQWDPHGGVATGTNVHRLSLGGFALIVDYEQIRDGAVTFTGHGVYTYAPDTDLYTLHWFDCMGSPPEVFAGRFEDGVLTLAHGGPGVHARMTYDLSSPGELRGRMEMSPDGADWKLMFEATYARV